MLKKYRYLLIIMAFGVIGLVVYKNCSVEIKKPIPITYDKQHVKKLSEVKEDDPYWKKRNVFLKKVNELEEALAEVYQITGENGIGWSDDTGDFVRIKLKLGNGRIVQFDNLGGWLTIS